MKRPLVPVVLLYAGGIVFFNFVAIPTVPLLILSLSICAVALVWDRVRLGLLCLSLVLAGATNLAFRTALLAPNDIRNLLSAEPALVTIRGKLLETPTLRVQDQDSKN